MEFPLKFVEGQKINCLIQKLALKLEKQSDHQETQRNLNRPDSSSSADDKSMAS